MSYKDIEEESIAKLKEVLARPVGDIWDREEEVFDPWDLFPYVYGSYSSAFDDMAIEVLENMQNKTFKEESLAHEMFREMLCVKELAEYGTSPRGCWANGEFRDLLPELLAKWKEYRKLTWETER